MVVELIAKDKEEKLQFEGRCKLIIDSLSKFLLVEPFNEEFKMISALFKWEFVPQKNILFVFAEYDFQDFALVFDDTFKCNKVYGFLLKKGASSANKVIIKERFLPPLFDEISKNNPSTSKFKEILLKWIQLHHGKEKEEYIQLLKNYNIYDLIYPKSKESSGTNPRKRKLKDISKRSKHNEMNVDAGEHNKANNPNNSLANKSPPALQVTEITILDNIVEAPNFEILKYIKNGVETTELFVYPFGNKNKCYNYFWDKKMGIFTCFACLKKKQLKAAKIIEKDGNDAVQLLGDHICEISENKEIIEKPNFELFAVDNGKNSRQRLVIFFDSARTSCYEFAASHKVFNCCGCMTKKHYIQADICQKEDGTEFVLLKSGHHVCEPRKFNPEGYGEKEIVETNNFKIYKEFRNGKDKSKLVIFASSDKTTCYEYYWDNRKKKFVCLGCNNKKNKNRVIAELCLHGNGNNYLKLSKKKHACEPREFKPEKFETTKKEIVESSNFRILKYKNNGVQTSKLIVFCETNKNLCNEYYWNKKIHLYQCPYCPVGNRPTATLCQTKDSKEYVMLNNVQHECDLKEFDPDKYKDDITVDKSMYEKRMTQNDLNILLIYTSKEKQYYYKFIYNNTIKHYYCSRCRSLKIHITATIEDEGTENERVFMSRQKHVCEPIEYSNFTNGYIIKAPMFQLIKRKFRGKIHQHLVVFTNEEKIECYEYGWDRHSKIFKCNACKNSHKISVYAKNFKNDENEECVELSKNEHKCQPIPFIPENDVHITVKIVEEPDFKLYEIVFRGKNMKKLAIFDSENRNMGYVYTYVEARKKYICPRCTKNGKFVTATIIQQENGQNYVELNGIEHVCELQKL